MSTTSTAISFMIGGAVGASLGKAVSETKASISDLRKKSEQDINALTNAMNLRKLNFSKLSEWKKKSLDLSKSVRESRAKMAELEEKMSSGRYAGKEFKSLSSELLNVRKETQKLENQWKTASDKAGDFRKKLKEQAYSHKETKSAIELHKRELERLSAVQAGQERIKTGKDQIKQGITTVGAVTAALTPSVTKSANYQAIIRDIAIGSGIAGTKQEEAMSESIRRNAANSGMGRNELAGAVKIMANSLGQEAAVANARNAARFSVSQDVGAAESANLIVALQRSGINTPEAIEKALGKIAVAGGLGGFESKDMAKHLGPLLLQLGKFGMSGESAVMTLANLLQTQRLVTSSSEEAAANLDALFKNFNSGKTAKKFEDAGINLDKSMRANIAQGYDPIAAFLGLVQTAANRTDPAKAKEIAALQSEIAQAQDPAAAQKLFDSYVEMAGISEFLSDQNSRQAALAVLRNQKLHNENLKTIQTTDGVAKIEKNLAERRAASKKIWEETGNALDEVLARFGDAIRPVTDGVAQLTKVFLGLGSAILGSDIGKKAALVVGAAATGYAGYGLLKAGRGAVNMAGGALQMWRSRKSLLSGGLPGLGGGVNVGGMGKGGLGSLLSGASGGTPVFVTNWPGGGLGNVLGGGGKKGGLLRGLLSNTGTKATGLLSKIPGIGGSLATRAGMSLPAAMGAGSGGLAAGAATAASSLAMLAGAGAAGYGAGTLINAGINKTVGVATGGKNDSLGGWLYDKFHAGDPDSSAPITAEEIARARAGRAAPVPSESISKKALPAPAPTTKTGTPDPRPAPARNLTFSPTVQVTVQGDAKDPRQIATELMPHLKRMFDEFQAQTARGGLYDTAVTS